MRLKDEGYYAYALGKDTLNETYWVNVFNPQYGKIPTQAELAPYARASNSKTISTGVYATEQLSYENLLVNVGIRYDHISSKTLTEKKQTDSAVSLSAGAMYQLDFGLSPYVSYADSFEAVVGVDQKTGKALKPKESQQLEAGLKYQPEGHQGYLTASYFNIKQKNLNNPNGIAGSNMQIGEGKIYGYELEGYLPISDFAINATAAMIDSEDQNGYQLASVPKYSATTWISYKPTNFLAGFKTGFGARFNGASQNGTDTLKTPSYTLMDAMVGYENDRVDVALNVNNLTDKTYVSTCLARGDCYYGTARTAVLRVAAKF